MIAQGHLDVEVAIPVGSSGTAALIVITCVVPIAVMLIILPFLGMMLNGTSSVLYGTVPELAPKGNTRRAFALFYTGVIGSGGLAPIAYGTIADHSSQMIGILSSACTSLMIVPLVIRLRRFHLSSGISAQRPASRPI